MSELPQTDPRLTEVPQAVIDNAHEIALARDRSETTMAIGRAAIELIKAADVNPATAESTLAATAKAADEKAIDSNATGVTRDQTVARSAQRAFNRQKRVQDKFLGNVEGISDATRARTAASNAVAEYKREIHDAETQANLAENTVRMARLRRAA